LKNIKKWLTIIKMYDIIQVYRKGVLLWLIFLTISIR
jgi:hypothetical protein